MLPHIFDKLANLRYYSINYMTNREAEQVLEVDRHNPKIMRSLRRAPRYRKVGKVQITIARGQEQITTRFTDGRLETTDIAKRGDGIVTNPGGEQYIIDPTEMTVTYSLKRGQRKPQPGETRTYVDKGQIRSRRNPYKRKITMMASWGYMQNGGADAMLADTYNPKKEN